MKKFGKRNKKEIEYDEEEPYETSLENKKSKKSSGKKKKEKLIWSKKIQLYILFTLSLHMMLTLDFRKNC